MNHNILTHIQHFQRHGELRTARRPLTGDRRLEISRRQEEARQAVLEPQPGWLNVQGPSWERFRTQQRCLLLEYGRYQAGHGTLLTVRIAPDGTALMRVFHLGAEASFQQRLYCPSVSPSGRRERCSRFPEGPRSPLWSRGGAR
ncbi:MAG: hypothetical protein J0I12_02890 [Candidatus Eremiobacteraeota bacterium]|nr:hypothetical protein [Candidatus Eremiobacteraeota bacterium]